MRWLIADYAYRALMNRGGAVAAAIGGDSAFVLRPPNLEPGGPGTGVARYRSFAAFRNDLDADAIDPVYRWVLYDPESWPDTPKAEQADPPRYMQEFGQLAHSRGYRVIMTPARDLAFCDPDRVPARGASAWYLDVGMAETAAEYGDVVSIQSQALTEDLTGYAKFVSAASRQVRDRNPYALRLAGVSTTYGTAAQMAAAAKSVKSVEADGFWLNVPGPNPDYAKAAEFLRLVTA